VPEILTAAELRIVEKKARLTVRPAARVAQSEVVADRLKLRADATGSRSSTRGSTMAWTAAP